MMERSFHIAIQARRYRLLSERAELLYPEADVRAERVLADDNRSPLDVMLLAGAGDLDRLCAAAVAKLNSGKQPAAVLDLLGVLPSDNLLAIHAALPPERRGQCESDHVWAHHISRAPEGIEDAMATLSELAMDDLAEAPESVLGQRLAMEFRRFSKGLLRRELGLPHDLSEDELALAEIGESMLRDAD